MKLAVILSRFPYPLEKGDKLRAYHQIRELSKSHELFLFCLTDQPVSQHQQNELQEYCTELHVLQLKKPLIYWNTAKQFFTDKPYQVGYFYQRAIQKKLNHHLTRIKPDHLYCQLIRTTEYVKNVHDIKKTVDYMDALGIGMQRRAAISRGIRKRLFLAESRRLTTYENRIFDYFDHHTIISEQDRQFINHPQNKAIVVVENGISDTFFNYEKKVEKTFELVFNGNMNYPPNIECAVYIGTIILPELQKIKPNAQLLLSGANPHPRVLELAKLPGIEVSGWVDDIRDSYAKGRIFVAPLFIGTGLQNKLLEAMAMGLPCITTQLANNALKAENGKSILIGNDAKQFVECIVRLLDDAELAADLGRNGKNYVHSNYNWTAATSKLLRLIES